jgi:ATP-dependent DNA helicase RecG
MLREQVQPDRVTWRLPMVSLIPEESLARLEVLFGKKFNLFNKNEVQALVTADVEGSVDNARMRQICAIHATDVTRLLQGLVAKGALMQEGQGRWSRYRLPAADHSLGNARDSEHKAVDSLHSDTGSLHKADDSIHNPDLLAIAAPARQQKRLAPAEMEQLLLKLCQNRWLSRHELSVILARNAESLRQRFLNPMVEHGLLRLRYPDKPNRADQAYSAGGVVETEVMDKAGMT